ncbi:MAG: oligopeptide/dipeptide ABC transporter ATP-binding protein, partial [Bacillota bacterium]
IRKKIQMIFQDPHSSLNPRMTVKDIIGEPLVCNNISRGKELEERVKELLDQVGLQPQYMRRYPHAFSGGQRQRIGIARALAINPDIILADEPVSALDVSIQAQILNLLEEIHHEFDLTMIFISHDLSVVRYISDRIAVMYVGKIVEIGKTDEVFNNSRHPYTRALLSAVPSTDPDRKTERIMLEGDVADPATEFAGCRFADRCQYAQQRCREENPKLKGDDEHQVACFYPLQ